MAKLFESLEIKNTSNKEDVLIVEKNIVKIKQTYKGSSDLGEKLYYYFLSVCNQMERRPVLI